MAEAMEFDFTLPSDEGFRKRKRMRGVRSFRMRDRPLLLRRVIERYHIDSIRLINFKAFQDTGWIPLSKKTFLMGGNSAGKSSILNAIKFISSVILKDSSPMEEGDSLISEFSLNNDKLGLNLGTINETLFDGASTFTIELRISRKSHSNIDLIKCSFTFGKRRLKRAEQITEQFRTGEWQ